MSLLMEALRKAEAAKRAGQSAPAPNTDSSTSATEPPTPVAAAAVQVTAASPAERPAVPDKFTFTTTDDLLALSPREETPPPPPPPIETIPVSKASVSPPALGDGDDVLDDYLTAVHDPDTDDGVANRMPRETIRVEQEPQRLAAASMFNAKSPGGARPNTKRRLQILSGAMVAIMIIIGLTWAYLTNLTGQSGIGINPSLANFNTKNRTLSDAPAKPAQPAATMPAANAGTATVAGNNTATSPATPPAAPATNPQSVTPPKPPVATAVAPPTPTATVPKPATPEASPPKLAVSDPQPTAPRAGNTRVEAPVQALPAPTPVAGNAADTDSSGSNGKTLTFSRSNTRNNLQAELQAAYKQLQNGEYALAYELYQTLVSRHPNSRDGLLGLANAQLKLGRTAEARVTYGRALTLNPQDALARIGLMQTIPSADPATYESELLKLHNQFPDVAQLSFVLGNLYAQTNRWHEAQNAYFDASVAAKHNATEPVSPDYAFNLAVSLERLGQKRTALGYYKEAETLAKLVKPGFDPELLRQRIAELGPAQ